MKADIKLLTALAFLILSYLVDDKIAGVINIIAAVFHLSLYVIYLFHDLYDED